MTACPTILVVDDVPENIEVLAEALSVSYDIQCAFSGEEALQLVAERHPDIILLDVMMPTMDGYEVLVALKSDLATRDIPVIFVTAKSDAESESAALTAGAVDFIHKPINADVVRSRVGLHLALKARENELLGMNTLLEAKVAQRTHALELNMEDLKLAKEAVESSYRTKATFLANMSHELRTPMNAIIGLTGILRRRVVDADQQDKLDKISRAATHLMGLINQILDLTNMEANRLALESSVFRLGVLPENLDSLFVEPARENGLEFSIAMSEGLRQQSVVGDPLRLQQVVASLVGNAVKFTEQGFVRVSFSAEEVSLGQIVLRMVVEDSGIGIEAEALKRIFSPFEQVDGSMTRRFGGSGLGLAISRQLVALMGGSIQASSTVGQGSTFICTVCLEKSMSAARLA